MKAILAATWLALLDRSYGDEAASIQTLTSLDGFGNLIPCARGCIAENGAPGCGLGEWGDNIAHAIGCDYNCKGKPYGARNSCFLRRIWAHQISFFVPRPRNVAHPGSGPAQGRSGLA